MNLLHDIINRRIDFGLLETNNSYSLSDEEDILSFVTLFGRFFAMPIGSVALYCNTVFWEKDINAPSTNAILRNEINAGILESILHNKLNTCWPIHSIASDTTKEALALDGRVCKHSSFSACGAWNRSSFSSSNIVMTLSRTIFSAVFFGLLNSKWLSAKTTTDSESSASPVICHRSFFGRGITGPGAVKRFVFSVWINLVRLTTVLANKCYLAAFPILSFFTNGITKGISLQPNTLCFPSDRSFSSFWQKHKKFIPCVG